MTSNTKCTVTQDPWGKLKSFTDARIALGRAGTSVPLEESLKFKLAHARARDAVLQPPRLQHLAEQLQSCSEEPLLLTSNTQDRAEYLTRPDKGRRLAEESLALLESQPQGFDICLTICDGLSAPAIEENALEVAQGLLKIFGQTTLTTAPVCLVENGRVAIGDHIASTLDCRMVIVLIGERPGLSSPNSLGAYITFTPTPGTTDEARNCVSNIRQGGMMPEDGVRKIAYLVEMGFQTGNTGVALKDKMEQDYLPFAGSDLLLSS